MVKIKKSKKSQKKRKLLIRFMKTKVKKATKMKQVTKDRRHVSKRNRFPIPLMNKIGKVRQLFFILDLIEKLKQARKDFFRKMILIYLDLGVLKKPIIQKKKRKLDSLKHLAHSPSFLLHLLKFLLKYPFGASTISKILHVKLRPSFFMKKKLGDLQQFCKIISFMYTKESKTKRNFISRLKKIKKLIKVLIRKQIYRYNQKRIFGYKKYNKLYHVRYKMISKIKWRRLKIEKKKRVNKIIIRLKNKKSKRLFKINNNVITLLFILNNLINGKKNKIKDVNKNLKYSDKKTQSNTLDFFYNKHINEIKDYCFK